MNCRITKFVLLVLILLPKGNNIQVLCFSLDYVSFPSSFHDDFILSNNTNINGVLQLTLDALGPITNQSGRILYKNRFRLYDKGRIASFNSTFVLNIQNQRDGGGEGLAFVLTKYPDLPPKSEGQWLGMVNPGTNGSRESYIVGVEFDTKKSFPEDIDDNHVGLDINSVYSKPQESLNSYNISIAGGTDVTAMILYNGTGKMMNVYIFKGNRVLGLSSSVPVMSVHDLDLSQDLPSKVFIGFSASTGSGSQLNCIISWYFHGDDISLGMPLWAPVVIPLNILLLLSFLFVGYLWWRKSAKRKHVVSIDDRTLQGIEIGLGPKKIKLKDLKEATGNFVAKNELGRGGFGVVYYGIWEGNQVAVKRITNTPQGKQNLIAEVTTIGSLHHKNLVKLIGWCYESDELLLVYEYMPNNSLDKLIYTHDENQEVKLGKAPSILAWESRHNIICGVAQALDYLHNECSQRVLHRDIKASNIMLDLELNARLGDFGLARMFKLSEKTHHSTKEIAGTLGYMAPDIFHTGRTTVETDVFAFGVLILVVACGRKPVIQTDQGSEYHNSIIDWVWEQYRLEIITDAIDTNLEGNFDEGDAKCMLVLGLACCHPNPYMRPSMRNALQVLIGESLPPMVPFDKPAFIWPATPPLLDREEYFSGGILTPYSSLSGRGSGRHEECEKVDNINVPRLLYMDRTISVKVDNINVPRLLYMDRTILVYICALTGIAGRPMLSTFLTRFGISNDETETLLISRNTCI